MQRMRKKSWPTVLNSVHIRIDFNGVAQRYLNITHREFERIPRQVVLLFLIFPVSVPEYQRAQFSTRFMKVLAAEDRNCRISTFDI
jgi:hypothetical protein